MFNFLSITRHSTASIYIRMVLAIFILDFVFELPCVFADNHKKKKFVLLTIDGGGVRGVIPARILQEIEAKTNRNIHQLVDTIAGNSTGGIIALALAKANATGRYPEYQAANLVDLYMNYSKDIFERSLWYKIKTGFGLWGAKYSSKNLDNILYQLFGNSTFNDLLKPVLTFSYNLDTSKGHIWNSSLAKLDPKKNFYLRDIAAATSAAPTYFDPVKLSNINRTYCRRDQDGRIVPFCIEADGGIFSNNPEIIAVASVLKNNRNLKISDIIVVSLGTGVYKVKDSAKKLHNASIVEWLIEVNIIDLMLNASEDISDQITKALGIEVYRIEMHLPQQSGKLDDTSQKNLTMLFALAESYLKQNEAQINILCKLLLDNAK